MIISVYRNVSPKLKGGFTLMKSKFHRFLSQKQLQWMVLPGIAFMIVFNYIPIYGIIIAFKNYTVVDNISTADWVGLENFRIIFEDSFFWEAVRNTLAPE